MSPSTLLKNSAYIAVALSIFAGCSTSEKGPVSSASPTTDIGSDIGIDDPVVSNPTSTSSSTTTSTIPALRYTPTEPGQEELASDKEVFAQVSALLLSTEQSVDRDCVAGRIFESVDGGPSLQDLSTGNFTTSTPMFLDSCGASPETVAESLSKLDPATLDYYFLAADRWGLELITRILASQLKGTTASDVNTGCIRDWVTSNPQDAASTLTTGEFPQASLPTVLDCISVTP